MGKGISKLEAIAGGAVLGLAGLTAVVIFGTSIYAFSGRPKQESINVIVEPAPTAIEIYVEPEPIGYREVFGEKLFTYIAGETYSSTGSPWLYSVLPEYIMETQGRKVEWEKAFEDNDIVVFGRELTPDATWTRWSDFVSNLQNGGTHGSFLVYDTEQVQVYEK